MLLTRLAPRTIFASKPHKITSYGTLPTLCTEIFEQNGLVPWDQILNFWAVTPNADQLTHIKKYDSDPYRCRWTPHDFLVHVDRVFLKHIFSCLCTLLILRSLAYFLCYVGMVKFEKIC